jgi:hypothetical protein
MSKAKEGTKMKKIKPFLTMMFIAAMILSSPFFAAGLEIQVDEKFSTGEPAMILVKSEQAINPANIKLTIEKPNGVVLDMSPQRQSWTGQNECFDIYTIDINGIYKLSAQDTANGQTATASFTAGIFTTGSAIFLLASVAIFIVCMAYWLLKVRKRAG